MADAVVDFAQAFTLRLNDSVTPSFKEGPQKIDEALLDHFYVKANIRGRNPQMVFVGSPQFLEQDRNRAEELQHLIIDRDNRIAELKKIQEDAHLEAVRRMANIGQTYTPAEVKPESEVPGTQANTLKEEGPSSDKPGEQEGSRKKAADKATPPPDPAEKEKPELQGESTGKDEKTKPTLDDLPQPRPR